jgi:tripartite-type tricarboxylate transporter receptor subunit TctC
MSRKFARRGCTPALVLLPVVGLLATACGGEAESSNAEDASGGAESCYDGETVTFLVPYPAGGGYDVLARGLAPFLEEELAATVVVQNMPGAGSLTAANALYTAESDGLTIGIFPAAGIIGSAMAEAEGAPFDPLEFTYVASTGPDLRVLTVGAGSEFDSVEDFASADVVRFASSGPGGPSHIDPMIVSHVLGIDVELVTGFTGGEDMALAVTSGDLDAGFSSVGSRQAVLESGDHRPLLISAGERAEDLPDTPALTELDMEDDRRAVAEAHAQLAAAGRPIIAPPGVPENCTAQLRDAVEAAMSDSDVLARLEAAGEPIEYLSGEDLEEAVRSLVEDSPEEYVALLKEGYATE